MSDVSDEQDVVADPQSQPPAGHLRGEPDPTDGADASSRAAPEGTVVTPTEASVPGGDVAYRTRSQGHPAPYSLGPKDAVVFDEKLLPKGQSEGAEAYPVSTRAWTSTGSSTHTPVSSSRRPTNLPLSEGTRLKVGRGSQRLTRTSSLPEQGEAGERPYPLGEWARKAAQAIRARGGRSPAVRTSEDPLPVPAPRTRASASDSPPPRTAPGAPTSSDLQSSGAARHLKSPVRASDDPLSGHLLTDPNLTPVGPTQKGGKPNREPRRKGKVNPREGPSRTPSHLTQTNPTNQGESNATVPILQPTQPRTKKGRDDRQPIDRSEGIDDDVLTVVRRLFNKMPDETGPQIRMPWFQGKPDEKVERYFRELERLKAIYDWTDAKLLNMALHGLRGRADDWVQGLTAAEKDTFAHLKESMCKIFGDQRAVWQKQTDFFALRQEKDQTVLDFAGVIKQHQGKAEVGAGTVLAVFLDGLKGPTAKQVAIQNPKTFEEAVAIATRLESLDKNKSGKLSLNAMSSESPIKEPPVEEPEVGDMVKAVERLSVVLARIEGAPWNKNPGNTDSQADARSSRGYGGNRAYQKPNQGGAKPKEPSKDASASADTGQKASSGGNKKRYPYKKTEFNPDKFCMAHQKPGHNTDECVWLKERLKKMSPPPSRRGASKEADPQGN